MKKYKWATLGIVVLFAAVAYAANDIVDYKVSGSSKFKVTSAGNTTIAGTAAISGNTTVGGTLAVTGVTSFSAPSAPYSRTIAQLNALAPSAVGQFVYCSDCARSAQCVSTATVAGSWSVTSSTAAWPLYNTIHCQ